MLSDSYISASLGQEREVEWARVHSVQSAEEAPPNLDTIRSTGGNKLNINFLLCYRLHKYLLSRYGHSIKCILYYSLSFQKNQHTCRYAY